ncbi:hypothetical protein OUZ56_026563 [Daphnia magna]|uniref:Secreted protein n=1 Tax=Daphnia magna TaxID=35525 RepID=A0ABQ9ZM44_9CRUS|nr:hypothetical protein OUZ56_026563 [Daphnia magna]
MHCGFILLFTVSARWVDMVIETGQWASSVPPLYALKMELCSVADSWLLMSLPMSCLELSSDASLSAFSFPAVPIWLGTQ